MLDQRSSFYETSSKITSSVQKDNISKNILNVGDSYMEQIIALLWTKSDPPFVGIADSHCVHYVSNIS